MNFASIFSTFTRLHFSLARLPRQISSWYWSYLTVSALRHLSRVSFVSNEQKLSDWSCLTATDFAKSFSSHLWKLQAQFCLNNNSVNWHFSLIDFKLSGWIFVNELWWNVHWMFSSVDVGLSRTIASKLPKVLLSTTTLCQRLVFSHSGPRKLILLWAIETLLPANSIEFSLIELTLKVYFVVSDSIINKRITYMFFSKINFVMPTSWIALVAISSILQFITAKFSNAICGNWESALTSMIKS